ELCDNTFSGSDHEDANEHIEKVLEIVDLFHIPNITIDQVMHRAFPVSLTGAASRWLKNKPSEMQDVVLCYNGLDVPTGQIIDSKGAIPTKTAADAKDVNNVKAPTTPKISHSKKKGKPSEKLTTLNLVHLFKEGDIEQLLQDSTKGTMQILPDTSSICRIGSLQYAVSTSQNSTLMYQTKQTTISFPIHLSDCHHEDNKGSYGPQFLEAYSYGASHIDKSIPRKEKDPGSFTLPCYINNVCFNNALAELGASISVMPLLTFLNLGLGELAHTKLIVNLADRVLKYPKGIAENVLVGIDYFKGWERENNFKSVKPAISLIKGVYMLSLRERMELDLEARLIRENLALNRSLDLFFEDYIEINELNVPLELKIDQVDDLMPTIKEGKVGDEFRARNNARMVRIFFRYPSDCDHDKKIHIDYAYNLKFSCMIVLEDMDAYRDEGMSNVIFGEPFLREVGIKARRLDGMITIYNSNESVTYQMVRSHLSKYKTAQELWPAIMKTFGGNEANKKTKKNQLKQQYRNFKVEGLETLKQTFNRLHAIVSLLEFIDVEIEQDDLNKKFLTSLAPEWLISGKIEVNTACIPTASTQVSIASADVATASFSHDTVCAYIASQSNGSQIKYEDMNQIDKDDIKEMDIKWNIALLMLFPLPAQVYCPSKKDMSWTGLPEFADDTITNYSRHSSSIESNSNDIQSSNSSISENGESSSSILSKPVIKFVKASNSPTVIKTNKDETVRKSFVKYAEMAIPNTLFMTKDIGTVVALGT
nr:hypothetical protein [Tanacetum cinerariifolium]